MCNSKATWTLTWPNIQLGMTVFYKNVLFSIVRCSSLQRFLKRIRTKETYDHFSLQHQVLLNQTLRNTRLDINLKTTPDGKVQSRLGP